MYVHAAKEPLTIARTMNAKSWAIALLVWIDYLNLQNHHYDPINQLHFFIHLFRI